VTIVVLKICKNLTWTWRFDNLDLIWTCALLTCTHTIDKMLILGAQRCGKSFSWAFHNFPLSYRLSDFTLQFLIWCRFALANLEWLTLRWPVHAPASALFQRSIIRFDAVFRVDLFSIAGIYCDRNISGDNWQKITLLHKWIGYSDVWLNGIHGIFSPI